LAEPKPHAASDVCCLGTALRRPPTEIRNPLRRDHRFAEKLLSQKVEARIRSPANLPGYISIGSESFQFTRHPSTRFRASLSSRTTPPRQMSTIVDHVLESVRHQHQIRKLPSSTTYDQQHPDVQVIAQLCEQIFVTSSQCYEARMRGRSSDSSLPKTQT